MNSFTKYPEGKERNPSLFVDLVEADENAEATTGENIVRTNTGRDRTENKKTGSAKKTSVNKHVKNTSKTKTDTIKPGNRKDQYPKKGESFLYDEQFLEKDPSKEK